MSNKKGATELPQQPAGPTDAQAAASLEDPALPSKTLTETPLQSQAEPPFTSAIRPVKGSQPARKATWRKKQDDVYATHRQSTLRLSKRMNHLKQVFELQQILVQWNMHGKT